MTPASPPSSSRSATARWSTGSTRTTSSIRPSKVDPKDPNSIRPDIYAGRSSSARTSTRAHEPGSRSSAGRSTRSRRVTAMIADGPATRARATRARPERGRRVHAVGRRLQLRRLDPHQREARQELRLHLDPHRRVRVRRPRSHRLSKEEITRDIPNVGEEALKDLDEVGHRAHRRRGQGRRHHLVGKIHRRRAETSSRRRKKLLLAIFGERVRAMSATTSLPRPRRA